MANVPFAGEVIGEMKTRPYTMIVILSLLAFVPYLWHTTARAEDVEQLTTQVMQISASLIEAKLERINAQLFDIKAKIADKAVAHEPIDAIYTDKVKELEAEKAHTERQLAALEK